MAAITLEELLEEVGLRPEKLDESISDDHILAIALFLTSWREVAVYLGLSENDIDVIEHERKHEKEKRLGTLQKWKGKYAFKATYRKLLEVLLSLAMADVAEKVCRLLKGMSYSSCVCSHSLNHTYSMTCTICFHTGHAHKIVLEGSFMYVCVFVHVIV